MAISLFLSSKKCFSKSKSKDFRKLVNSLKKVLTLQISPLSEKTTDKQTLIHATPYFAIICLKTSQHEQTIPKIKNFSFFKEKMDEFDAGANRPAISSGMVVAHYELGDTIGSGS